MEEFITYEVLDNIPVFKCKLCGKCSCIETRNIFNINRGCCFYFPKYTLIDIKNISSIDKEFLYRLVRSKNCIIHSYYLEVMGTFDKSAYDRFLLSESDKNSLYEDFDAKLIFRKCSFIGKSGCKIDFRLRPHPCNLYLCREVVDNCNELYKDYSRERKDYFAYCRYMNEVLEEDLRKKNINLQRNFSECLNVLQQDEIWQFQFSKLDSIYLKPAS